MSEAKRGQGAFEYILMLAGVLLIVILIIFILNGTVTGAGTTVNQQQSTYNQTVSLADIVPQYTPNLIILTQTGSLNNTNYPCCLNPSASAPQCPGIITNCTFTGNSGVNCVSGQINKKVGRCV